MRVTIDGAAYGDLDAIYAWIARDRPAVADFVIDRILAAAEHLGRFPRTGHPGREPGTYEWVVRGLPYIIVFEVRPGASSNFAGRSRARHFWCLNRACYARCAENDLEPAR